MTMFVLNQTGDGISIDEDDPAAPASDRPLGWSISLADLRRIIDLLPLAIADMRQRGNPPRKIVIFRGGDTIGVGIDDVDNPKEPASLGLRVSTDEAEVLLERLRAKTEET